MPIIQICVILIYINGGYGMRVISKEYQAILDKSSAWNYIQNTPKPDFSELDKEVAKFERWIKKEHKKDRQLLREATDK